MRVAAFDYELPPELIAQRPESNREAARLMRVGRESDEPEHRRVADLPDLLPPGALVVLNDTRVIPARLLGRKRDTGGKVEILLVRAFGTREIETTAGQTRPVEIWHALGKASKGLRFGADLDVHTRASNPAPAAQAHPGVLPRSTGEAGAARLTARLLGRAEDGLLEVALWTPNGEPVRDAIRATGHVPLPPYIKREDEPEDENRYQTVYARHDGAVAAPTAGLHLTNGLLGRLAVRGCEVASVTLHVGLGTFQPVQVEDLDDHPMHAERYVVTPSTAEAIARARARGAPVVAVGTTTARALESAADPREPRAVRPMEGETRLLIQPGFRFQVVDVLFTNFHLPRSTLLAMVCAFAGTERVLAAYRAAVRQGYRVFSYGDAMLLERRV
ncbi:MAG: tRNA preQ1(34) S-adenosylmethionine ribosyltransferase-isomerase QueA [Polyangiaceae bacterium]|nr:tRNA preQ1(34) S-adenosylmethionine ribosyltransferase-isomerase QueA [Polyangiaceae bacterium]